jgi:small subunit ribosomal protein S16
LKTGLAKVASAHYFHRSFWSSRGGQIWKSLAVDRQKPQFMAVRIRMKRVGAKNDPVFRIVVADSRSPRDGKFIEELGTYHPLKKGNNYTLDLDRARYWVSKGALPSETVASFIKRASKAALAVPAA